MAQTVQPPPTGHISNNRGVKLPGPWNCLGRRWFRVVMHSKGMAKNPICPRSRCNYPETIRHLLWECGTARDLWAKIGPLYFPCLPNSVPARHLWGGLALEGLDSTGIHLALAYSQRHQGFHLGHQKPVGGDGHYGTSPCMRAKGNINVAGAPDDDIQTGGLGRMESVPASTAPVDAPSPLWQREQRAREDTFYNTSRDWLLKQATHNGFDCLFLAKIVFFF